MNKKIITIKKKTDVPLFAQTGQMIELCYEYLSVRCI